jgi:hypothetical protein
MHCKTILERCSFHIRDGSTVQSTGNRLLKIIWAFEQVPSFITNHSPYLFGLVEVCSIRVRFCHYGNKEIMIMHANAGIMIIMFSVNLPTSQKLNS